MSTKDDRKDHVIALLYEWKYANEEMRFADEEKIIDRIVALTVSDLVTGDLRRTAAHRRKMLSCVSDTPAPERR
jgi:cell division FtsZ-interacting protein ZapD